MFERLRDKFNTRSALARDAFMQIKFSHALDNNKKGVWHELRNIGLLPKQQELHGIGTDFLKPHFASVSTTDARVSEKCNEVISQASEENFQFSVVFANDVILAVAHFSLQAGGSHGITQLVFARALPFLGAYLRRIFNASLKSKVFFETFERISASGT